MCTNYRPGSRDFLRERFGGEPAADYEAEAYPAYAAPIVRAAGGDMQCRIACFGLIPHWSRDTRIARSTYNARSETVAIKPSFRRPWQRRQFCLVPMQSFYEPSYESGRAVRWRIERADAAPFAVAGVWECWQPPAGGPEVTSFTMLTINADGNALMQAFHAPGEEKRSIVVIEAGDYDTWLRADATQARELLRPIDAPRFVAVADPRVRSPRVQRA